MYTFKKIDLTIQLLVVVATLVTIVVNLGDELKALIFACLVFYGGMAVWQLVSAIVHLVRRDWVLLPIARLFYFTLLPIALGICFYPVFAKQPDGIIYAMATGLCMAVYYFIITLIEFNRAKRMSKG